MILTEKVIIKWGSRNKKWYVLKGYIFTKMGDEFEVKIEDLSNGSGVLIKLLCDYCLENDINTVIERPYDDYLRKKQKSIIPKDCCFECKSIKTKESQMLIYGVENTFQREETKQKSKDTCQEKYHTDYAMQNIDIKERARQTNIIRYGGNAPSCDESVINKMKQTNLERYGFENALLNPAVQEKMRNNVYEKWGVEYVSQHPEIKLKIIKTVNEKYGVDNYFQSEEFKITNKDMLDAQGVTNIFQLESVKKKSRETMLLRYGFEYYSQTEECRIRCIKTSLKNWGTAHPMKNRIVKARVTTKLFNNGTAPCSTQQRYICDLTNGELNYPVGACNLDIAFLDEKIYIEYDGSGHDLSVKHGDETAKNFKERSKRRYYFLFRKGWKEIQIISLKDKLPSDDKIIEIIEYAKDYINTGHSWIKFDTDNSKIINSQGEFDYDFGELRKIKTNKELDDWKDKEEVS